ncbi:hypothetical protein [Lactiplantibacillus songbeiensis]|uniref:Integral membrane protein n=1 Tax=Lactiplantibacillus songbeiensis TaxID=2559920 RepID=A0ABW4C3F2_9LACO|nr:hypothetical protein [Lactiplantibacillus songbeiensis]
MQLFGDIVVFIYLMLALCVGVYHLLKHVHNHSGWVLVTADTTLTVATMPMLVIFGMLVLADLQLLS